MKDDFVTDCARNADNLFETFGLGICWLLSSMIHKMAEKTTKKDIAMKSVMHNTHARYWRSFTACVFLLMSEQGCAQNFQSIHAIVTPTKFWRLMMNTHDANSWCIVMMNIQDEFKMSHFWVQFQISASIFRNFSPKKSVSIGFATEPRIKIAKLFNQLQMNADSKWSRCLSDFLWWCYVSLLDRSERQGSVEHDENHRLTRTHT